MAVPAVALALFMSAEKAEDITGEWWVNVENIFIFLFSITS